MVLPVWNRDGVTTYRDYLWIDVLYPVWAINGYCTSLIRDASPDTVLDAIHAGPRRPVGYGINEAWTERRKFYNMGMFDSSLPCESVDVADVGGGWTLLNSDSIGIRDDLMASLIADHEVISHYRGINADHRFMWWRDGRLQLSIELGMAGTDLADGNRWGPEVTATIRQLIEEVGGIELEYAPSRTEFHEMHGAFALAERLSGVQITEATFDHAPFTAAVAPIEPMSRLPAPAKSIRPQLGPSTTWGEMAALYRQSLETAIHADYVKTEYHGGRPVTLQVWYKPFDSWRLHDADGLFLIRTREDLWYRNSRGEMEDNGGDGTLPAWPADLIYIEPRWDAPLGSLLPADAPGTAVTIADRPAWEFTPSPDHTGITARVAFDAETGIALRWASEHWTEELTRVEIEPDLPDDLFLLPTQIRTAPDEPAER